MRPLIIFLLVFGAALFGGALFAWPVHLIIGTFTTADFSSSAKLATQLSGLIFSLLYLRWSDRLDLRTLGLRSDTKAVPQLVKGFAAGFFIFAVLGAALYALGIYAGHSGRLITSGVIVQLISGALLTGFAVALFEETVFRGALLQGLYKQAGATSALAAVSLMYAAVHFINYVPPADHPVNGFTAPSQFITVISGMFSLQTMDALLALFVLGLLFGLLRLHSGNLIQCIGVHAGIVAGVKLFRFFTEYQQDNSFPWLVSAYDQRLGWMAFIWLTLILSGYIIFRYQRQRISLPGQRK